MQLTKYDAAEVVSKDLMRFQLLNKEDEFVADVHVPGSRIKVR